MRMSCDCRPDLVMCFSRDCPRARRLSEEAEAAYKRAQEALGDPRISVGFPSQQLKQEG